MTLSALAPFLALLPVPPVPPVAQQSASAALVDVENFGSDNPFRPRLALEGSTRTGASFALTVRNAGLNNLGLIAWSTAAQPVFSPALQSTVVPGAPTFFESFTTFGLDAEGLLAVPALPAGLAGLELVAQAAVFSPLAPGNFLLTDGQSYRFGAGFDPTEVADGSSVEVPVALAARFGDLVGGPGVDLALLLPGAVEVYGDVVGGGPPSLSSTIPSVPTGATDLVVLDAGDGPFAGSEPDVIVWSDGASAATLVPGDFLVPQVTLPVQGGIRAVQVFDADGDGDDDVAVLSAAPDRLSVFRQDSDFTFTPLAPLALQQAGTPQAGDPVLFGTGLVDGDALPDLVVGLGRGELQVVAGGGAQAPTTVIDARALGAAGDEAGLALGDLDGQGGLDAAIAVGGGAGRFELLFDLGAAAPPTPVVVPVPEPLAGVAIADLNADGAADLVGARSGADGLVDGYALERDPGLAGVAFGAPRELAVNGALDRFALSDADGDGLPELVAASLEAGRLTTLPGRSGGFPAPLATSAPAGVDDLRLADVDGDGVVDALTRERGTGDVWLQRGNGDGTFQAPSLLLGTPASELWEPADLDGDGDLDLAVVVVPSGLAQPSVRIYANDGLGTFGPVNVQQSTPVAGEPLALIALRTLPLVDSSLTPLFEGAQGLAVVSRGAPGQYLYRQFRSTTEALDPAVSVPFVLNSVGPFALGSDEAVGVATIDLEGDGVDEVLITSAGAPADGRLVRAEQGPTSFLLTTEGLALDGYLPGVFDGDDLDLDGVASSFVLEDRAVGGGLRVQQLVGNAVGPDAATSTFGPLEGALGVELARLDEGDFLDLAVLFGDGSVDVGQGGGALGSETFLSRREALLGGAVIAIDTADLDGDGRDELVGLGTTGGRLLIVAPKRD